MNLIHTFSKADFFFFVFNFFRKDIWFVFHKIIYVFFFLLDFFFPFLLLLPSIDSVPSNHGSKNPLAANQAIHPICRTRFYHPNSVPTPKTTPYNQLSLYVLGLSSFHLQLHLEVFSLHRIFTLGLSPTLKQCSSSRVFCMLGRCNSVLRWNREMRRASDGFCQSAGEVLVHAEYWKRDGEEIRF